MDRTLELEDIMAAEVNPLDQEITEINQDARGLYRIITKDALREYCYYLFVGDNGNLCFQHDDVNGKPVPIDCFIEEDKWPIKLGRLLPAISTDHRVSSYQGKVQTITKLTKTDSDPNCLLFKYLS